MSVAGCNVEIMNTAKIVKILVDDSEQKAACYEVSPPLAVENSEVKFLYVSAINNPIYGLETMVFASGDAGAEEIDWSGLVTRKDFDHVQALAELGYEIAE